MTLFDCYTARRDALLSTLAGSPSPAEAAKALEQTFDMVQYQYCEECKSDFLRARCAEMMSAAKSSFPLLECVCVSKVWHTKQEKEAQAGKKKPRVLPALLLLLGALVLAGAAMLLHVSQNPKADMDALQTACIVGGICCLLFFFSGLLLHRRAKAVSDAETRVELSVSAEDLVRRLTAVLLQIDKNLAAAEADETARRKAEDPGLTREELDLYSELLESYYSESADLVMESLAEIEHYLHNRGIELSDYDPKRERWFELLPSKEAPRTLRPALLRDGKLLRKGLATHDGQEDAPC